MWIRSQDKTTLAYCTRLAVVGRTIQNLPPTMFEDDYDRLGTYETKEKALEVLNEIEKRLFEYTEIYEKRTDYHETKKHMIFQMPKE